MFWSHNSPFSARFALKLRMREIYIASPKFLSCIWWHKSKGEKSGSPAPGSLANHTRLNLANHPRLKPVNCTAQYKVEHRALCSIAQFAMCGIVSVFVQLSAKLMSKVVTVQLTLVEYCSVHSISGAALTPTHLITQWWSLSSDNTMPRLNFFL